MHVPVVPMSNYTGYRLVNSKFPPIALFDDVASHDQFDAIFLLQSLTNPRLNAEVGNLSLIHTQEIPFGIQGCSAASASFTHVNPDGSRFSDGKFGLLYLAKNPETAIKETVYHQTNIFGGTPGLKFDSLVMREYKGEFSGSMLNVHHGFDYLYDKYDYTLSQAFGKQHYKAYRKAFEQGASDVSPSGISFASVRDNGLPCWALFTPRGVTSMVQKRHFEYIYDPIKKCISDVKQLAG